MAPILKPFQLLEINVISAQDLDPISKKMQTYCTVWLHRDRKLSSGVNTEGKNNPTWNDKFVFRVNDEFLQQEDSAVMIEIYTVNWFRDKLIGTAHVLVRNLLPPLVRSHNHHRRMMGMRFVALQVRRPSGRPQGILNISVALLDSTKRSMPLDAELSSSGVGYHDHVMEPPPNLHRLNQIGNRNKQNSSSYNVKPILRRSRSERSEHVTADTCSLNGSVAVLAGKKGAKESSILSISECVDPFKGIMLKKGKASSVISGAELRDKPKQKGRKVKGSSVLSDSILSKESSNFHKVNEKGDTKIEDKSKIVVENPKNKAVDEKSVARTEDNPHHVRKDVPISKHNGFQDYDAPKSKYVVGAPFKGKSPCLDSSEVGPSPSEVAAAMMANRKYPLDDKQSSVLDGWSLDESVEGLRSKLERWRTNVPPLHDRSGYSSSSYRTPAKHARRHTDGGTGLFSCFGNIYGYECQCVCGKPPGKRAQRARFHSPSFGTSSRSFL
ncbi:hypothetical protein F511_02802 [Dorcoceras hygrometricum]|uniref:C2 domain-containing protein n=1 Tax=Dorcoceras hygrometricum TaxID=472368 RepID=A0A2Z7BKY4_9LAMI|nr:hypothetical protein F511_02802 [Dorcoceras hygrometricum]